MHVPVTFFVWSLLRLVILPYVNVLKGTWRQNFVLMKSIAG